MESTRTTSSPASLPPSATADAAPFTPTGSLGLRRYPWWVYAGLLAAVVPGIAVAVQAVLWIRNIPNWDEFDTVLDLLIALDGAPGPGRVGELLLAANNEHRMLISRLLFAGSYWLFGGINFAALAAIGNVFLVGALALLISSTRGFPARLRLAAVSGLVVFQLQQHENFFWGGSSIDHLLVVLTTVAALRALTWGGRTALALGCLCAIGGMFSLAHGMVVWPAGAVLLALARRWRDLALWSGTAALSLGGYFVGFHFNPGHRLPGFQELPGVLAHWLGLLGASPALEHAGPAPWLGAALLVALGLLVASGIRNRERVALATAGWCVGGLAMIAWGRALLTDAWAPVTSRYIILSSLAWALLIWMLWERALARWGRRTLLIAPVLVALAAFNVVAGDLHQHAGRTHAQKLERAVWGFHYRGTFEGAAAVLYPDPQRANELIREAEARGLYRLPAIANLPFARPAPAPIEDAQEVDDIAYFLEEVTTGEREVTIRGWAFRRDQRLRDGDISVVFRTADQLVAYETIPLLRPDVAREYRRRDVSNSGFAVRIPRDALPAGQLGVGVCFNRDDSPEYMMTAYRVDNRLR